MKRTVLSVAALACLSVLAVPVMGQNTATPAKPQLKPAVIGLVDMAKVFKEYKKFEDLRTVLQGEMQAKQAEAQAIAKQAQKIKEELKLLTPGSPDFVRRESDLARLSTEFETKGKLAQAHLRRREAEIFEDVYRDAIDVVKLYAEYYGYTMVIRFNSEPLSAENPQKLTSGLNKLVVYSKPESNITEAVYDYLNRKYKPSPATTPRPSTATQPTGTSRN